MRTLRVRLVIDEVFVASTNDPWALIEPLWRPVDIYGSWERYLETLKPFTVSQRHLFAIQWYRSEVCNGGHDQFFGNSTGIVWEHALEGLLAAALDEVASLLRTASDRLGGASRDRTEREKQLESPAREDFDDLDDRFYLIEETGEIDEKLLAFARQHAGDFRFTGMVERADLSRLEDLGLS